MLSLAGVARTFNAKRRVLQQLGQCAACLPSLAFPDKPARYGRDPEKKTTKIIIQNLMSLGMADAAIKEFVINNYAED